MYRLVSHLIEMQVNFSQEEQETKISTALKFVIILSNKFENVTANSMHVCTNPLINAGITVENALTFKVFALSLKLNRFLKTPMNNLGVKLKTSKMS
ncbi:hypothetical protein FQA39_LY17144 [Lamprigera yunnana]|nr:hypothetical protein FQA39_LY17144 [Lamprigera yunnana]